MSSAIDDRWALCLEISHKALFSLPDSALSCSVALRMRPLQQDELEGSRIWKVLPKFHAVTQTTVEGAALQNRAMGQSLFTFDHVFGEDCPTNRVYAESCQKIVEDACRGFNGSIFAYGQTCSGKTFTMQGRGTIADGMTAGNSGGILHLTAQNIFLQIQSQPKSTFVVGVGAIQVYNDEIRDLLAKNAQLRLRADKVPYKVVTVPDSQSLLSTLAQAESSREFASTSMNHRSSRSHTIFRISIESVNDMGSRTSNLDLVDLAGSESVGRTGATGDRLKEGGMINQSLLALSKLVRQLGAHQQQRHTCFRDSALTKLLKPSLSGNARVLMICCATPSEKYCGATKSTLQFAEQAKLVKTNPQVNAISRAKAMKQTLKRQHDLIINNAQQIFGKDNAGPNHHPRRLSDGGILLENSTPKKSKTLTAKPKTGLRPSKPAATLETKSISPSSEATMLRQALAAKNRTLQEKDLEHAALKASMALEIALLKEQLLAAQKERDDARTAAQNNLSQEDGQDEHAGLDADGNTEGPESLVADEVASLKARITGLERQVSSIQDVVARDPSSSNHRARPSPLRERNTNAREGTTMKSQSRKSKSAAAKSSQQPSSKTSRRSHKRSHEENKRVKRASKVNAAESLLMPSIGARVEVWFGDDKKYYGGTVTDKHEDGERLFVKYDDGDTQYVDFKARRYRLIASNETSNPKGVENEKPKATEKPVETEEEQILRYATGSHLQFMACIFPLLKQIGFCHKSGGHYSFAGSDFDTEQIRKFLVANGIPNVEKLTAQGKEWLTIWAKYAHADNSDFLYSQPCSDETIQNLLCEKLQLQSIQGDNDDEPLFVSVNKKPLGNMEAVRKTLRSHGLEGAFPSDSEEVFPSRQARRRLSQLSPEDGATLRLWAAGCSADLPVYNGTPAE